MLEQLEQQWATLTLIPSAAEREEGTRGGLGRLDAMMQHEHVTGWAAIAFDPATLLGTIRRCSWVRGPC